jgi:hypothetical protein
MENNIEKEEKKFEVYTVTVVDKDSPNYVNWSEGLRMYIIKDGVSIRLESDEIEQLVRALPETVGGTY